MRVVVTGGAGFIGANLVRELEARDGVGQVVVIDDLSTGDRTNLEGTAARFLFASITDDDAIREAVRGADAIVHLAARPSVPRSIADPVASHYANATGTLCVLEAARDEGVGHVIAASSSSVYGANPTLPKSEGLATRPMSPYAASKLATEAYTLAYGHSYELATLTFRFFNVFGPLQPAGHAYAAAIPTFVDAALSGRPVTLHGDGKQTRDFTYVGSVARVLADAVERRVSCQDPVNPHSERGAARSTSSRSSSRCLAVPSPSCTRTRAPATSVIPRRMRPGCVSCSRTPSPSRSRPD